MRTGKELLLATREFTGETRWRSWLEISITVALSAVLFSVTLFESFPLYVRILASLCCGLMYVRMFVIYHDYQHHAILQNSFAASVLMKSIGIYLLAPQNIWKRSHDHHHNHNSKLTIAGIGSYPTISVKHFLRLSKTERRLYLMNRHPLTVIFGYVTLFIYWLNMKSLIQSPGKHLDSLLALALHLAAAVTIWHFLGPLTFLLTWITPFFIAFGMGSYLFYCQHNFPKAQFRENHDWKYDHAAIASTSLMIMSPFLTWITGNIGYHHVHHLNSRIPFYRLKEAMAKLPELKNAPTTSWNPFEIAACFRLKLWDAERGQMIALSQLLNR